MWRRNLAKNTLTYKILYISFISNSRKKGRGTVVTVETALVVFKSKFVSSFLQKHCVDLTHQSIHMLMQDMITTVHPIPVFSFDSLPVTCTAPIPKRQTNTQTRQIMKPKNEREQITKKALRMNVTTTETVQIKACSTLWKLTQSGAQPSHVGGWVSYPIFWVTCLLSRPAYSSGVQKACLSVFE